MARIKFTGGILLWITTLIICNAQTIPVGFPLLEDYLRREQLTIQFDSTISFSQRPIQTPNVYLSSHELKYFSILKSNEKSRLWLLPAQIQLQQNTHHPYPENNGSMIPSKGFQFIISPGIGGNKGMISFQLKPEILYSQNSDFPGFPEVDETVWPNHRRWPTIYESWNRIDEPEKFGDKPYKKLLPGQSYLKFNYKKISVGISTQNLWWGPGKYNSLLLTNNSRGFSHLNIGTNSAVHTMVGSLEMQFVAGKLTNSGFVPPDTSRRVNGIQLYQVKPDDWRYFNGISVSYQPKWIKGLFVGINSTIQQYSETAKDNNDYLPILTNIFRSENHFSDSLIHDKMNSFFMRWVMLNNEIYFEYGRKDGGWNWNDFLMNPQLNSGYVIGISKLIPLKKVDEYIELNIEFTKLQQPADYLIDLNEPKSWYTHETIRHGYTNNGEILGSKIGPGGNIQTIEISKVSGLKKYGLLIERLVHNNDFNYLAFNGTRGGDFRSYWVDYRFGLTGAWVQGPVLIVTNINFIRSLNYQWETVPGSAYFTKGSGIDVSNFTINLNFAYQF